MALNLGAVVYSLKGDATSLLNATQKSKLALAGVNDVAGKVAKQGLTSMNAGFDATAGLIKTGFVAGIGAGIGVLTIATIETNKFNASMANVASLIPGSTARVNELKAGVQDLSIKMGSSTADISDGLYQVVSAFGDTSDSMLILETNAKAAKAGLATTTDAINLTSAVTKAYGDTSAEAVKKASDLALMTVRLGQTTFPELAASVGRVTPLMKNLGGSQEELFAVMATMTGVTGGASEVSTQLAGALQSLMAPTKDTTSLMKKLGFANGQAMIKGLGVQGSMQAIVNESKKSKKPLQSFIGSIEGQILALGLAGPQADDYKKKLGEMANAAGATDAAFAEQTTGVNALGFRFNQLKTQAIVLAQRLGDKLAPTVLRIADIIGNNLAKINLNELEIQFNNAVEKVRPLFETIMNNTPLVQSTLVGLGTVAGTLVAGGFVKMGISVISATWPFLLLFAAAAGLFYLFQTNQLLFQAVAIGLGVIATILLINAIPAVIASTMAFWGMAAATFAATWPLVLLGVAVAAVVFAILWLYQNWDMVWNGIVSIAGTVWAWLQANFFNVLKIAFLVLMGPIGWLYLAFSSNLFGIRDVAGGVINTVIGHFNNLMGGAIRIKDGIVGAFQAMSTGVGNGLKGMVNGMIGNINAGIGAVNNLIRNIPSIPGVGSVPQIPTIPKFKKGVTNFEGGLAEVHKDELLVNLAAGTDVITASKAKKMKAQTSDQDTDSEGGKKQSIIQIIINDIVFADDKNVRDLARRVKRVFAEEGI